MKKPDEPKRLPKKNLVEQDKEPPKEVEELKLETPQVPEYKLIDVMRELKTVRNDFEAMSEAVKALGADVIKNNEENAAVFTGFQAQIQELQRAFIRTVDQVLAIPQTKSSFKRVEPEQKPQPQYNGAEIKVALPPTDTIPISESAKKELNISFRKGVGTTVKFNRKVPKEEWDKMNTFLRAYNMKWVSEKELRIYEWQPKR